MPLNCLNAVVFVRNDAFGVSLLTILCLLLRDYYFLATLMLQGTGFSGDIPRLPENIVNFNIASAMYTGGLIDDNFAMLNNLNYLNLDDNLFNTSIPLVLKTLPKLEYVYLSDCHITGTLSPLEGMPVVRELWMDANPDLTGPLYSWIGSLTTLESLSLAYNDLTGTIPTEIGYLTNMKQLWLYSNNFTGPVPEEIGNLNQLTILQLENNDFQGWVPPTICVRTEFPAQTLRAFGADCDDEGFWCPCCSCCDLEECVAGGTFLERKAVL